MARGYTPNELRSFHGTLLFVPLPILTLIPLLFFHFLRLPINLIIKYENFLFLNLPSIFFLSFSFTFDTFLFVRIKTCKVFENLLKIQTEIPTLNEVEDSDSVSAIFFDFSTALFESAYNDLLNKINNNFY